MGIFNARKKRSVADIKAELLDCPKDDIDRILKVQENAHQFFVQLISEGDRLGSQGKFHEALAHLNDAVDLGPFIPNHGNSGCNMASAAHLHLGGLYFRFSMIDEAIREFEAAKFGGSFNLPDPHCCLGIAYQYVGKFSQAIRECRAAIQLDPDLAEAHCNLASAYQAQGKHEDAAKEFQRAREINPELPYIPDVLRGRTYQQMLDEGITRYEKEAESGHRGIYEYYNLGTSYAERGRLSEAIAMFKEVVKLNAEPQFLLFHNYWDGAEYQKQDDQEFVAKCEQALRANPSDARAHYDLGTAYAERLGELDKAISHYQEALKLAPSQFS